MTIRYNNGQAFEAVLLSQTESKMRIALQGSEDVMELHQIHGVWVSDDCEPVHVEFAWTRPQAKEAVTEADCICSHELAARLIHLLYSAENVPAVVHTLARRNTSATTLHHVI